MFYLDLERRLRRETADFNKATAYNSAMINDQLTCGFGLTTAQILNTQPPARVFLSTGNGWRRESSPHLFRWGYHSLLDCGGRSTCRVDFERCIETAEPAILNS
jgi:hypothetical protein